MEDNDKDEDDGYDPVSGLDEDSYVEESLDLQDSKHDPLIRFHEKKITTTFNMTDKEYRKTYTEVFNDSTLATIYRLFQRKVLLTVEHPISTGKEANVFLGINSDDRPVAVKIFRENTATFRKVRPYIEGDPRFNNVPRNKRQLIPIWAKKEFKNLMRLEHAGVRVPVVLGIDRNVLVMEYIGDDASPAPTLRTWWLQHRDEEDAHRKLASIFEDVSHQMRLMHQDATLVHSDLSEFNILIHEDQPYIIDVGQAVVLSHPMSGEFLDRDIRNIATYFSKGGIETDEASLRAFIFKVEEEEEEENEEEDDEDGDEYDEDAEDEEEDGDE